MANALITRVSFYGKIKEGKYLYNLYEGNHRMHEFDKNLKNWWHYSSDAVEGSPINIVYRLIKAAMFNIETTCDSKNYVPSNLVSRLATELDIDIGNSKYNSYITYMSDIFPSSAGNNMTEFFVDILSWNDPYPGIIFCKKLGEMYNIDHVGFVVDDEGWYMNTRFDKVASGEDRYGYTFYSDDPAQIANSLDRCFEFNGPFARCTRPELLSMGRLQNGLPYVEVEDINFTGTKSCMIFNIEQLSTINTESQFWDSDEDVFNRWLGICSEKGYNIEPFAIGGMIK